MIATTMYNEIQASMARGERIAIATVVKTAGAAPCGVGSKMLVRADGTTSGSFSGPKTNGRVIQGALQAIHDSQSHLTHIHLDADQGEAVGSCGATLEVFFEVLRPEPRLIIAGAGYVAQALSRLATQLDFRIVVVTRGHHLDKDALHAALETNAAYVGMIGSPSKVKHIFKDLLKEGLTAERLA